MNKVHIMYLFFAIFFTLLLTGCKESRDLEELKKYVETTKETVKTSASKKNLNREIHLPEAVTYQTTAFSSGSMSNKNGTVTNPLTAYPLKSFKYNGILTEGNQVWAYILAPDNEIYQVKEGDVLGNSYGKIIRISQDHVEVVERGKDSNNKLIERTVVLQLKD